MSPSLDLDVIESALAEAIEKSVEESAEDAILGFIEVDETTQQNILQALRMAHLMGSIGGMLRSYPCLTTYGLAVAAPIGMRDEEVDNGGFYTAWESAFGYMPEQSIRERLGLAFNRTLREIGLQTGTITPGRPVHYMGGCYLYQSGILPHFIQPLREALNGAAKRRPLPDPDDDQQCDAFARLLAGIVHPAQARLKKVLLSQIGGFLVRRLVRWHLTGDDSLFPPHVRELLAEQKGKAVFANSPYLCFDEIKGEIQLVLPAQSAKLADSNTRWTVPGLSPVRASTSRPPIPLTEIKTEGDELVVRLSHLKGDLENIDFKVRSGLSHTTPFLVFDRTKNREKRVSFVGDEIQLPPGQEYVILISPGVELTSDHEIEEIGEFHCIRYTANPGFESPVLRQGGRVWTIKPAIKAGLYLARDEATLLHVTSPNDSKPVMVSYGKGFQLTCCLPAEVHAMQAIFSTPLSPESTRSVALPAGDLQAGLRMVDLSTPLAEWISGLPDAVIRIEVSVPLPTRNLSTSWVYWKGLERITIYGDIRWKSAPENLVGHPGFRPTAHGLDRERRDRGTAELYISRLGACDRERWVLPSNRVHVSLLHEDGSAETIGAGEQIDLLSSDKRVVQFQSGGLMPVRLTADGKVIGVVSPDRPIICCYPAALLVEIGKAATIRAETLLPVPGEKPWPLVSWQSPLSAKECRTPEVASSTMVWKVRKISLAGLAGLRVSLRSIDQCIQGNEKTVVTEIPLATHPEESEPLLPLPGVSINADIKEKYLDLRIELEREEQKGTVWCLDVEGQGDGSEEWQPLVVPEAHGRLARVRFLLMGDDPEDGSAIRDLFWGEIRDFVLKEGVEGGLHSSELRRAIAEIASLLEWKYPTPVWQQNAKRLKAICSAISSCAAANGGEGRSAWWSWAVESIGRHANESQAVVIPELPILHGFQILAEPLKGFGMPEISTDGLVEQCFREAFEFENRGGTGCLAYMSRAMGSGRLDMEAVSCFDRFNQLITGKDVPLGKPKLRDWMTKVFDRCKSADLEAADEDSTLLSVGHLIHCLRRAKRRCHVLRSIASAEHGQWLSGPISQMQTHHDAIEGSVITLLGPMLQAAPVEVLWKPFTDTLLADGDDQTTQLMRSVMAGNLLIALALRRHASGMLSWSDTVAHLRKIVGGDGSRAKLHDQAGLLIGTAPELFAFYFLLFTLTS